MRPLKPSHDHKPRAVINFRIPVNPCSIVNQRIVKNLCIVANGCVTKYPAIPIMGKIAFPLNPPAARSGLHARERDQRPDLMQNPAKTAPRFPSEFVFFSFHLLSSSTLRAGIPG